MSALSSRFCEPELLSPYMESIPEGYKREQWELSAPFLEKAKEMVMSSYSLPTLDTVAALLMLAFVDFGDNNEAGTKPFAFPNLLLIIARSLALHGNGCPYGARDRIASRGRFSG